MEIIRLATVLFIGLCGQTMAAKTCQPSEKNLSVNVDNQSISGGHINYHAVLEFTDDGGAVQTINGKGSVNRHSDEITNFCVPKSAEHVDLKFALEGGFNGGKYKTCDGASQDIAKDSVMLIHVDPDVKDYTNFKCSVEFLTH